MKTTNASTFIVNLRELANYTKLGVSRKALTQDEQIHFALICLSAGTQMPEHTTAHNVPITVIEGHGILTLAGQEVALEPGIFVYMPANTPHALQASENLAFLHT